MSKCQEFKEYIITNNLLRGKVLCCFVSKGNEPDYELLTTGELRAGGFEVRSKGK